MHLTSHKATALAHQRESPHPPTFLSAWICPSHNKNRKQRPRALDTDSSCGRFDQSAAEIPSHTAAKVCKQSATEHDRPVCECLQYIINRRNLPQSNLVRVTLYQAALVNQTAIPNQAGVKFHHYWLKCGSRIYSLAYILSSLIKLISEARIKRSINKR